MQLHRTPAELSIMRKHCQLGFISQDLAQMFYYYSNMWTCELHRGISITKSVCPKINLNLKHSKFLVIYLMCHHLINYKLCCFTCCHHS